MFEDKGWIPSFSTPKSVNAFLKIKTTIYLFANI
jgi:hypothetical protein